MRGYGATIQDRVDQFLEVLNAEVALHNAKAEYPSEVVFYLDKPGPKFTRVVRRNNQRAVDCFIENATGKIVKQAGWKSPAKDKDGLAYRWDLMDDNSRKDLYNTGTSFFGTDTYWRS